MKRQTLVTGLMSLTAVAVMTGCVDDKYDLTDIDTTSRFTVDNLTVPVNLSEIKLENVVNLDDNDLIEKVIIDGKECYSIVKGGEIEPKEFSIDKVRVAAPNINSTTFDIKLPSLPVVPGILIPELPLGELNIDTSNIKLVDYNFGMNNVNEALLYLQDVTTTPIQVKVILTVPDVLLGGDNEISFKNLLLKLPWGLKNVKGLDSYNPTTGDASKNVISVGKNGKSEIIITAEGIDLGDKGKVNEVAHTLNVTGQVGVLGGALDVTVKNFTFQSVPTALNINVDYKVSEFTVEKFSGSIDYKMKNIDIAPITLNDLPDFLNNSQTNLIIANPQILVGIKNPVGDWLMGEGVITLTSKFNGTTPTTHYSDAFQLIGNDSNLAFCTPKAGYTTVAFDGLRNVLSKGGYGLPYEIEVAINDIRFKNENVKDFPLGDLGSAEGSYEFNAPLAFGEGSIVVYETTEDGWSSDDLDKVNINKIHLTAKCSTDLPVSVQVSVTPVDKDGKEIPVKEESGLFEVPAFGQDEPVVLTIESVNGPIKKFDGVKFKATITQMDPNNTEAIGPNLDIILKDIRVTVDGYYETDF